MKIFIALQKDGETANLHLYCGHTALNYFIFFDVLIHSYISNTYLNEYQIFYSKSIYDYIPALT